MIPGRLPRYALALLGMLCAAVLFATPAAAHAHLARADLAPDSHLLVPAGTYRFWFDEPINPALSRVLIRDVATGRQLNLDTGRQNATNGEELDLTLQAALRDGQYSVTWTSDSAQDGHILHGSYLFTAGGTGAAAPSAASGEIAAPSSASLDSTSLALAAIHWLVLVAAALWTGALALDLLVLLPARRRADHTSALALEAARRTGLVVRMGLLGSLAAAIAELCGQAYAAAGWSGLTDRQVLGDTLNSHYGTAWILRAAALALTLLVLGAGPSGAGKAGRERSSLPERSLRAAGALGLAFLLLLAVSGHAAAVPSLVVTSVLLDWLHLIAMSVWVGGMAAIALLLLPDLGVGAGGGRGLALLSLLDRYSPAAYLALATAAVSGMFAAQVHLDSLDALTGTAYGHFLLIKLALIAELLLLSGSHVFASRPRLRALAAGISIAAAVPPRPALESAADPRPSRSDSASAALAQGFESLALRLRIEPLIGALILLCVALMGQVTPAINTLRDPAAAAGTAVAPAVASLSIPVAIAPVAIAGTASAAGLTVNLTVDPAAVGQAHFRVRVREHDASVDDGQVRIRLSMPGSAQLGNTFVETVPHAGGYAGSGDLVQQGRWQAQVLVRTRSDPQEFRPIGFEFTVGQLPGFLRVVAPVPGYGAATVSLTQPTVAPDILSVRLRPGLHVRFNLSMESMPNMVGGTFAATAEGTTYSGQVYFAMTGLAYMEVQVQEASHWRTIRLLNYDVDAQGVAHLLTPDHQDGATAL